MLVSQQSLESALRHHRAGRLSQAEAIYREILATDDGNADALHLLGVAAVQAEDFAAAADHIRKAIEISPDTAIYHRNLAIALNASGDLDGALQACRKGLALNPRDADTHALLGRILRTANHLKDAEGAYLSALDIDPGHSLARMNLANLMQEQGRFDEAEGHYRELLGRHPGFAEGHKNYGVALSLRGLTDRAAASLREAIRLNPEEPGWRMALGQILLSAGRLEEGWEHYEWRWKTKGMPSIPRDFTQPLWDGVPLPDKTLLIHAEQGLGDTIQFCRYIPMAAARARVVVEVPRPLLRLLAPMSGIAAIVAAGDPLPDFDAHCPLMSLPRVFGTRMDNIPAAIPYLRVDADKDGRWRERLEKLPGLKIGLCWAGGSVTPRNPQRSIAAHKLASLGGLPGITFVSLQKYQHDGLAQPVPPDLEIVDWTRELGDLADTATLIDALDLVVSVDTAVAHLAGALGKPVWLLNRFAPCWRWLTGRDDSPWYPTLRQFRQKRLDDWDSVLQEVREALKILTAETGPVVDAATQRAQAAFQRGLELHYAGRFDQAVTAYDEALAAPVNTLQAKALVNKGVALRRLGRQSEALGCYWNAVAVDPDNAEVWCNAGNALLDLQRVDEAREVLRISLRRAPKTAEAWQAMASVLFHAKQFAAAETCLRRAIALVPQNWEARLKLANILVESGRPHDALAESRTVLGLCPSDAGAQAAHGQVLVGLGRLDEAEPHFRRALDLDDNHLSARLGLARMHLLGGNLEEGWRTYEWRRHKPELKLPSLSGPEWDGSDPAGKTILVYSEQGFGDVLQFIRYVPLLAERGARVMVACQRQLVRLLKGVKGAVSVEAGFDPVPPYDFHVPLLSLPFLFGTTAQTIPARVPYLVPPDSGDPLEVPLGTRLTVGLVWAGSPTHANDRDRSVPLTTLLPVAGVHGVAVYSLQVGARAAELGEVAHPALIADLAPRLGDYADTAAVIRQLDLVITVDTSVAHLAGALGKPVWVLTPFAPDWRWQLEREDSPWYPTMRLFRQKVPDDWDAVVERLVEDLRRLVASSPPAAEEGSEIFVDSIFPGADGTSRFQMPVPFAFIGDAGIFYLVERERVGLGYEYATRSFLDAHLEDGDLFIDIGAHWGIMSLQAVTARPGRIKALAIEPAQRNLAHLRRWVEHNALADAVEIIAAAASDRSGQGRLEPQSTMGHSVTRTPDGSIPMVSIDELLAERPSLQGRRAIVKIDVEGFEPEVIRGMSTLLGSGRVAAVIWERGREYHTPAGQERLRDLRAYFDSLGFTAWSFPSEDEAGPLVPFTEAGRIVNVFELAPGVCPRDAYGGAKLPPSAQPPAPAFDTWFQARRLMTQAKRAGDVDAVSSFYGRAARLDFGSAGLYGNLGLILAGSGKTAAAEACYRRALALAPSDYSVLGNLGNLLRQRGKLADSALLLEKAVALAPHHPSLHYNFGLLRRDEGWPRAAREAFDKALALKPDHQACRWDRALALLEMGEYRQGFSAYDACRSGEAKLPMPRWDGAPLDGSSILVAGDPDSGVLFQFVRFLPELKGRGAGRVVLRCRPDLVGLLAGVSGVDDVLPDHSPADCDVYTALAALPALLGTTAETLPSKVPYLAAPEPLRTLPDDGRLKLGLIWAGEDRVCPLGQLLPVLSDPRYALFSLQRGARALDLKALGADTFITDLTPWLPSVAEMAGFFGQLDLLVTADCTAAHLAGALGVETLLLQGDCPHWRWLSGGQSSWWYPNVTVLRQDRAEGWKSVLQPVSVALATFPARREGDDR